MPVALITGASRGLGRALAGTLAARGFTLVLDARGAPDLDAVAQELAGWTRVVALAGDVADAEHRAALAAERPDLRVYGFDPGDMRTDLHQQAFPGEDISDRPEPETVVPALLRLIDGDLPSGRYRVADLAVPA